MKTEKRGSEKLMQGCTSLNTLSREELEQVAGGALLGGGTSIYWKQFPHGIPWPEIFKVNVLREIDQGLVRGIDQQLGRGF